MTRTRSLTLVALLLALYFFTRGPAPAVDPAGPANGAGGPAAPGRAELAAGPVESAVTRAAATPPTPEPAPQAEAGSAPDPEPPPNGTALLVRARRDGQPWVGVGVEVFRTGEPFLEDDLDALEVDRFSAILDDAGEARFEGLEARPHWIALGSGPERVDNYASLKQGEVEVVEFTVGSASLFGTVRDGEGEPVADAYVTAGHRADSGIRRTRTELDGSYRIEGLTAGPYHFSVVLNGDPYDDGDVYESPALEAGEARQLDVGPSLTAGTLSGRLLDASGDPVRLPAAADLQVSITGGPTSLYTFADVDAEGAWSARLEPGTYRFSVELGGYWESVPLADDVEMPDHDRSLDLTVPGVTVRGRLSGGTAKDRSSVRAAPAWTDSLPSSGVFRRFPTFDGERYTVYGLPPGTWRLGARGHGLDEFTEVVLADGDTERVLDLTLP